MTDKFNTLTVVLENDIREDNATLELISAIRQLRGVLSVTGNVANLSDHLATERARRELIEKLWQVLS